MRSYFTFLCFFLGNLLAAQSFIEVSPSPFEGVSIGSIAFADIDNDTDSDVLITGRSISGEPIAKLYSNDGDGNFSEIMNTSFEAVDFSSVAFADVDGDGDSDLLIMGDNLANDEITKLYKNDGNGNFSEVADTPFAGLYLGSLAFTDIDNDSDLDLLITGSNSGEESTKLYVNNGTGDFSEITNTLFEDVNLSAVAFADVDGDNDPDVIISGQNSDNIKSTKLYLNDGNGNFIIANNDVFEDVSQGDIAFADIDGNNTMDVILTGQNNADTRVAKMYINDGAGNFTQVFGTPFTGVKDSTVDFSDVDGDTDLDVLITGSKGNGLISKLYTNNGSGIFSEVIDTPFDNAYLTSVGFIDVNGDNLIDVLISGYTLLPTSKLYLNESTVSVDNDLFTVNFRAYPNPTFSQLIQIEYNALSNSLIRLELYDAQGKLWKQQQRFLESGSQTFLLNLSGLQAGIYFLQLNNGKKSGIQKIVVKK